MMTGTMTGGTRNSDVETRKPRTMTGGTRNSDVETRKPRRTTGGTRNSDVETRKPRRTTGGGGSGTKSSDPCRRRLKGLIHRAATSRGSDQPQADGLSRSTGVEPIRKSRAAELGGEK